MQWNSGKKVIEGALRLQCRDTGTLRVGKRRIWPTFFRGVGETENEEGICFLQGRGSPHGTSAVRVGSEAQGSNCGHGRAPGSTETRFGPGIRRDRPP